MNVVANFSNFMVFGLKDSGERERLYLTEQEFSKEKGNSILQDSQVVIIVKEESRRIYIWKGYQSTVRKKFIASRVAQELQQELMNSANFHHCKIVSIDQGDEPSEFINLFGFKLHETLNKKETRQSHSPTLNNHITENKISTTKTYINLNNTRGSIKKIRNLPNKSKKQILNKILQMRLPSGYKRNYILIGNNNLYGTVTKKTEIFGKTIEESGWELFNKLPMEIIELKSHKLRVHFDKDSSIIEVIEVLERESPVKKEEKSEVKIDHNKWTVKQLKAFCAKNNIKVPSSYRKAQIINLVEDYNTSKI
ncbi:MAG: hypothetical protein ACFFB0_21430 [Promethearchaeota archaeon]